MTVQPVDWYELCLNSAYDQDADELEPTDAARQDLTDGSHLSVASSSDSQRRPTNLPHGGSAHPLTFASPGHRPVFAGELRPADASVTSGRRDANLPPLRACICGLTVTPTNPYGNCHGGRACLERFLENEARRATNADGPQHDEPQEARMTKDKPARNLAASWR